MDEIPDYLFKYQVKDSSEFTEQIFAAYSNRREETRNEGKVEFVSVLKSKEIFGFNFYSVKLQAVQNMNFENLEGDALQMILGLGKDSVRLLTTQYELVHEIKYLKILKWGYSDIKFSLIFWNERNPKNSMKPSRIDFQTLLVQYSL